MTKKQLIAVYAFITFMMVWGSDLLNAIKYKQTITAAEIFGPFTVTQILYVLVTLILTRLVFIKYYSSQKIKLIVAVAGLIILFISLRYSLEEMIFPLIFNYRNYNPNTKLSFYILDNLYYAFVYIVLGILVFLLDNQVGSKKKQALLIQQSRDAELAFLRSQINPHFLFNSLNNIYALSYKNSPKTPEAILKLSELMRYMLYEKQETISLNSEWQYVQNFISLQQLRYDHPLALDIKTSGNLDNVKIPSYLLIPFIENAFKHGDFSDETHPLKIDLTVTEAGINFYIENKTAKKNKEPEGGIGLENVKRRLALLYPNQHQIDVILSEVKFSIHLQIKR